MFNVGFGELLLFIVIAVIVLGPTRLPEGIRFVLHNHRKLKRWLQNAQSYLQKELHLVELQTQMQEEMKKIKAMELELAQRFNQIEQLLEKDSLTDQFFKTSYTSLQHNIYAPDYFRFYHEPQILFSNLKAA